MENQNQQQTIVIVPKPKSLIVAFLLAFGPLGLLYSTVAGGIIMLVLGAIIGFFTLGFGLIFIWIACIIWAIVAANVANAKANGKK